MPLQVVLLGFWASDGGRAQRYGHKNKIEIVILTAVRIQTMKARETKYFPHTYTSPAKLLIPKMCSATPPGFMSCAPD